MPRQRPATSGYARLSQAEEEAGGHLDDSEDEDIYQKPRTISTSTAQYAPIQSQPHGAPRLLPDGPSENRRRPGSRRHHRRNSSGVDIKAINARLERWADEIASKFKINKVKGKTLLEEQLEIHYSVFQPPDGIRPVTAETLHSELADNQKPRMTKTEFDHVVESVRTAIELGVHPNRISQGSSGSYFARNAQGKTVGVFKPKDEEPYASRNPKWTKWIHRNLFPCFFGRACLIPNLSYVSEAAAYVLDTRLRTNLVPHTDIVHLSSKSFFYDYWQRSAFYRKRKPLPPKPGSFQVFLKGFKDANVFLRDHPWPDHTNTEFRPEDAPPKKRRPWNEDCRPRGIGSDDEDEETPNVARNRLTEEEARQQRFFWTPALQQSFREELEKLVVLDYIMRNTDRGLDNWMIKVDWHDEQASNTTVATTSNGHAKSHLNLAVRNGLSETYAGPDSTNISRAGTPSNWPDGGHTPTISIGAIDNSLSWPWKHPDAWRSFPFGWLFLPVSLIGQPFSQTTRDHFLPLLTSTDWWSETQVALRRIFSQDADFQEKMFARQIAVMKGQAWNVVETLKIPDHGPLELTRRARVCVWDDLVDIPVAIPLRTPSTEMRRQAESNVRSAGQEEEMDISAVNGTTSKPPNDLIKFSPPNSDSPNPNRFELSRNPSASDLGNFNAPSETPTATQTGELRDTSAGVSARASLPKTKTRSSYDGHRRRGPTASARRRYSFSARHGSNSFMYDGDDLEGDLGYAAAEDMERSQRKVIVERLETVKSKNPVFSWC